MSQQPKQPDVFNRLEEDVAGDPPTGTYIAPDEPMGSHAYGTTSREEGEGETFAERTKHTLSEDQDGADGNGESDFSGVLVQDGDQDVDLTDGDAQAFAWSESDEGDTSAEESAMHIIENP